MYRDVVRVEEEICLFERKIWWRSIRLYLFNIFFLPENLKDI